MQEKMSHNSLEKIEITGFQTSFLNKTGMNGISIIHNNKNVVNVYNEYLPMLKSQL